MPNAIPNTPVSIETRTLIQPRLNVMYPVVTGMGQIEIQNRINETILATVCRLIQDQGYYDNPMTEITGSYELKTNERGVLSLSLINYAFAGGAHGSTLVKSLTVDTTTGHFYTLAELFKPGSNYRHKLSGIIRRQIQKRDIPLLTPFKGIRPDQDYYLADKALVIYFQQYELTAYAYGFPCFPITLYQIPNLIPENGILERLAYCF